MCALRTNPCPYIAELENMKVKLSSEAGRGIMARLMVRPMFLERIRAVLPSDPAADRIRERMAEGKDLG